MFIRRKAIFSMLKIGEDGFAVFQNCTFKNVKATNTFFPRYASHYLCYGVVTTISFDVQTAQVKPFHNYVNP